MLLCGCRSKHKSDELNIFIEGEPVKCVHDMKYLGVIDDRHLSFEQHITHLCSKISNRAELLWRVWSFITKELAGLLYNSLIYPHMLYANFILEGCTKQLLDKFKVQHSNALWAVLKADYRTLSAKLYNDAHVDPVNVTMKQTIVKIVYKGLNDIRAPIYSTMFNYAEYSRDLYSSDKLLASVPKCRTKFGERNAKFWGPSYWNQLPIWIKNCSSYEQFKEAIKKYDGFT